MANETRLGMNRTGMQMSPRDSAELLQGSERAVPTTEGDEAALARIRAEYIREGGRLGSVSLPGTLKGVVKTGMDAMTGSRTQVLLDKLGERLAFERGGTRLYQALIIKCLATPAAQSVIEMDVLDEIHNEEARHVALLNEAIESLGADPTAQTPCADLTGVQCLGLVQAINDPRTSVAQCVQTMLIAELADNAGWELLIKLAAAMGHERLSAQFQQALDAEEAHLATVKGWLERFTLEEAKLLSRLREGA